MTNQRFLNRVGEAGAPAGRYDQLLEMLRSYSAERVFNQYRDDHPTLDLPRGAALRQRNLQAYLDAFRGARYVLVGEGAGYAGCRFSGIPFTCEEQLVGQAPLTWTRGQHLGPSSTAERLWTERSATIVWGALGSSRAFLLWNAFPWHPFGEAGLLSNRAPGRNLRDGLEVLRSLLTLYPQAQPIAIGRVAERALAEIGVDAPYVRHPSHGGKRAFCAGIEELKRSGTTQP